MQNRNEFISKLFEPKVVEDLSNIENSETDNTWMRAYAEVYQLLQHSGSLIENIPKSFRTFLYESMEKNWGDRLDFTQEFDSLELLKETRILLSLIYRDFICTEEKRKELVAVERTESEKAGVEYDDQSLRDLFAD